MENEYKAYLNMCELKRENKFYIFLNGICYDLRKVKKEDEHIFLEGCNKYGEEKELKGFLEKFVFLVDLFCNPLKVRYTKEYIKAYLFFKKRENINYNLKERKMFKKWLRTK